VLVVAVLVAGTAGYLFGRSERGSVALPDVREMTIRDGALALHRLGLCVGVEQGSGPERRPIVAEQRPPPGVLVLERSVVTLVNASPDNLTGVYAVIGARNRDLGCIEGLGARGESDGAG
jgi:beta-lactam-binding protein with PASTA domain